MAIKDYYNLTKPRMVQSNVFVAVAAFIFGSAGEIEWGTLFAMLVGLSFIVASACVLNNYFDRRIDALMERTKNRALPAGRIGERQALLVGGVLVIIGIVVLHRYAGVLALGAALFGFVVYVLLYTPLKHRSAHSLYVGALAGATPPLVGYAAATNTLDLYALVLFLALYLWQIPHFLSIAVYRFEEYKAAGIPLVIKNTPSQSERRRARTLFYSSLGVLFFVCLILILQRWMR